MRFCERVKKRGGKKGGGGGGILLLLFHVEQAREPGQTKFKELQDKDEKIDF